MFTYNGPCEPKILLLRPPALLPLSPSPISRIFIWLLAVLAIVNIRYIPWTPATLPQILSPFSDSSPHLYHLKHKLHMGRSLKATRTSKKANMNHPRTTTPRNHSFPICTRQVSLTTPNSNARPFHRTLHPHNQPRSHPYTHRQQ